MCALCIIRPDLEKCNFLPGINFITDSVVLDHSFIFIFFEKMNVFTRKSNTKRWEFETIYFVHFICTCPTEPRTLHIQYLFNKFHSTDSNIENQIYVNVFCIKYLAMANNWVLYFFNLQYRWHSNRIPFFNSFSILLTELKCATCFPFNNWGCSAKAKKNSHRNGFFIVNDEKFIFESN